MFEKYFKPKSLTWWASVVPLVAGIILASEPLHGQIAVDQVIRAMFGNAEPATLINMGLAGIGLRGAVG